MVFGKIYFPPKEKRKRELEFEYLEQKDMLVVEYFANFISLERFSPGPIAIKKMRTD